MLAGSGGAAASGSGQAAPHTTSAQIALGRAATSAHRCAAPCPSAGASRVVGARRRRPSWPPGQVPTPERVLASRLTDHRRSLRSDARDATTFSTGLAGTWRCGVDELAGPGHVSRINRQPVGNGERLPEGGAQTGSLLIHGHYRPQLTYQQKRSLRPKSAATTGARPASTWRAAPSAGSSTGSRGSCARLPASASTSHRARTPVICYQGALRPGAQIMEERAEIEGASARNLQPPRCCREDERQEKRPSADLVTHLVRTHPAKRHSEPPRGRRLNRVFLA